MTRPLSRAATLAAALTAAFTLAPASAALAQSAGCAALNATPTGDIWVMPTATLTLSALNAGETVTISGTGVSTMMPMPGAGWYITDPTASGGTALSPTYDATLAAFSHVFTVASGGMLSFGLRETGPNSTQLMGVSITCAAAPGGAEVILLSGFAQQQSISSALGRNFRNRFGLPGAVPQGPQNVFASTKGQGSDVSAWVSLSGRSFWDGYDGSAADLSFGVDSFVSANTLVGVMVGLNRLSVSDATGASTDADAAMIGLYGAQGLAGDLLADGYLAWSRVSYDAAGSSFDTDRIMAGLGLSGSIEQAAGQLQPRARLSAAWEDFPTGVTGVVAGNSQQITASLGARFDWRDPMPGTALTPFLSIDIEYGRLRDTSGVDDDYLAPRLGLGVNGMVGAGRLSASLDIGKSGSNVQDAGLDLTYEMTF
ncbi:MAG: autotransporter outer membrane beta-barrel domain-containing protein [Paracoccaceae bacterium]